MSVREPERERQLKEALRIAQHQLNPFVHPYTCGIESNHLPLVPMIRDGEVELVCLGSGKIRPRDFQPERCAYTQIVRHALTPEASYD
jgi:hypothetical protein